MSNIQYYNFEREFISAIMNGEPEAVRGALAGMVKHSDNARFVTDLFARLVDNSDPASKFRSELEMVKPLS